MEPKFFVLHADNVSGPFPDMEAATAAAHDNGPGETCTIFQADAVTFVNPAE